MSGTPLFGASRPAGARGAAIDVITAAARELVASIYRGTASAVRAVGVGVSDEVFERVATMHAERTHDSVEALIEQGWIELDIDGAIVRIISERGLARGAD